MVGPFEVVATSHAPDLRLPVHAHDTACLTLVVHGGFRERHGRHEVECAPGGILFRPAGSVHANQYGDRGAKTRVLLVSREAACGFQWPSEPRTADRTPAASYARRMFAEARLDDGSAPMVVEGLLRAVVGWMHRDDARAADPEPPWLRVVRDRVRAEFRGRLTISGLARDAGVSPDHLSRRFRARYGELIGDYQRRLRMEYAADRLRGSDDAISSIALEAGYADQSHFTRVFQRCFGDSPAAFRRAYRPRASRAR